MSHSTIDDSVLTSIFSGTSSEVVWGLLPTPSIKFILKKPIPDYSLQLQSELTASDRWTQADFEVVKAVNKKTSIHATITIADSFQAIAPAFGLSFGLSRNLTHEIKISFSLAFDSTGIHWIFGVSKLGQRLTVPIQIADKTTPQTLCHSLFIPVLFLTCAEFFLNSYERTKRSRKRILENNQLRKETQSKINLMRPQAERIRSQEQEIHGLVILKASYGKLNAEGNPIGESTEDSEENPLEWIDVTIPLQVAVENSQLRLPEGTKERMLGFFNPVITENPRLSISYLFHDQMHIVVIDDNQPLSIP